MQSGGYALATTLDSRGRIVTLGATGWPWSLVLSRLLPNGQPDRSLDGDGLATLPLSGVSYAGSDLVAMEDGAVAFPAQRCDGVRCDLAVVKLSAAGGPDGSFGTGGIAIADFGDELGSNLGSSYAQTLARRADGRLVVGGAVCRKGWNPPACSPAVAAFTAAGKPDTTFNASGHKSWFGRSYTASIEDLSLDAAGNAVVVGSDSGTNSQSGLCPSVPRGA